MKFQEPKAFFKAQKKNDSQALMSDFHKLSTPPPQTKNFKRRKDEFWANIVSASIAQKEHLGGKIIKLVGHVSPHKKKKKINHCLSYL